MSRTSLLLAGLGIAAFAQAQDSNKWDLNVSLGLGFVESNTRSQSISLLANAVRENKGVDRTRINGALLNTRQSTTAGGSLQSTQDYWTLGGRYDRNINARTSGYISARFTRDAIALLDLRSQYGFGLAYDVVPDNGTWAWRLSGGISFLNEQYSGSLGTKNDTGIEFGSSYKRKIGNAINITNEIAYIPKFSEFEDSYTTSLTTITYKMNANFNLGINYLVDYRTRPAPGANKKSQQLFLTLGYAAKF